MPPPIAQQGSRSGLITGLVVFVILWLVTTIFYFQERGQHQKDISERNQMEDMYVRGGYLPPLTPDAPEHLKQYKEMATAQASAGDEGPKRAPTLVAADNAWDLAYGELRALVKVMTGSDAATPREARDTVVASINEAKKTTQAASIKPNGVNFTSDPGAVVRQFADAYVKLDQAKTAADASTQQEQAKFAQFQKDQTTVLKGKDDEVGKVQEQLRTKQKDLDALQVQYAAALDQVKNANVGNVEGLNQQVTALNQQIAVLTPQIPSLQARLKRLQDLLKNYRMDPTTNMVRRADAIITAIPGDGTCYINLGIGDQITAGMTFEVYDKVRGIPGLNDEVAGMDDETAKRSKSASDRLAKAAEKGTTGALAAAKAGNSERYDTQLPTGGKGAIEVLQPGPNHTSVCRIIKTEAGAILRQGDLAANLVYDRNVKFKFAVYGKFDLDYNGVATPTDTLTIKRKIEEWGGRTVPAATPEDIGPEVDFLVMGIMPVIPTLSAEDAANAGAVDAVEKAKVARDLYLKVLDRAREYSIPVLNQTRFLYYTGFFDERTR
jgi:hypothetical protein